jgi:hypothetical protein
MTSKTNSRDGDSSRDGLRALPGFVQAAITVPPRPRGTIALAQAVAPRRDRLGDEAAARATGAGQAHHPNPIIAVRPPDDRQTIATREEQSRRIVQPTTETRETDRDRRRWSHERLVANALARTTAVSDAKAIAGGDACHPRKAQLRDAMSRCV